MKLIYRSIPVIAIVLTVLAFCSVTRVGATSTSSKSNAQAKDGKPGPTAAGKTDKSDRKRTPLEKGDTKTKPDEDVVKPADAAPADAKSQPAAGKPSPSFPKTVDEAKAEAEAAKLPPPEWTPDEITAAKTRCVEILKRISAVAIYEKPFKEGACGAPAPIQLISIGKNPEVALSPPATITCELAEGLSQWLDNDLQPLARKHLGAEIIKIENMSSYACRNAYGRTSTKLSEHGLANALDIRGFVTAAAKTAYVLEDWGTPQREILAKLAADKAAAETAAAERAAADKAAQDNQRSDKSGAKLAAPPAAAGTTLGAPAAGIARGTVDDGLPKVTVTLPGAPPKTPAKSPAEPALSLDEPTRLGGPNSDKSRKAASHVTKTAATVVIAKQKPATKTSTAKVAVTISITPGNSAPGASGAKPEFLHQAHAAACRIFGTTLGPEANAAHRNHFHVDMAPRKFKKICD